MALYHCYLLDDRGHIKAREILQGRDDSDAIGKTESYLVRHPAVPGIELWLDQRCVGIIDPVQKKIEPSASYRLHAERCRAQSRTGAYDFQSCRALREAAEQWDLLAKVTNIHSNPAYLAHRMTFAPPPTITAPIVEQRQERHLREDALKQIEELDVRIAEQQAYMAVTRLDGEGLETARHILRSYLAIRGTVAHHLASMQDGE